MAKTSTQIPVLNAYTLMVSQVLFTFEDEGGIPKVIANKLALTPTGAWLLPFWRENDRWDAGAGCNAQPGLMGVPAVLVSSNQARLGLGIGVV